MTSLNSIREELKELQKEIMAKLGKTEEAMATGAPTSANDMQKESAW